MEKGFYWIQHDGRTQVAYYTNGDTEDHETGRGTPGIWHLTQGDDIPENAEALVISGPLQQPV